MQKTVEELISEWTPEEREKFKDLIEECREREKCNHRNLRQSLAGLKRITDNLIGKIIEENMGASRWPQC